MKKLNKIFALFVIILIAGSNLTTAQDTKEFEQTYSMDKTGKVSIDTYKGSILVETWDKAEVEVYALMEADEKRTPREANCSDSDHNHPDRSRTAHLQPSREPAHAATPRQDRGTDENCCPDNPEYR